MGRDTVIYGLARVLSKSVSLITLPLLARNFSVEQYGLIDLFTVLTGLLITLLMLGQDSAVARYFFESDDEATRRQLVSRSLAFQGTVVLIAFPVFWVLIQVVNVYFVYPARVDYILKLTILTVPFGIIFTNAQTVLRFTFKKWQYLFLSLGFSVGTMSAVSIEVFFFGSDPVRLFRMFLFIWVVFGMLGLWFIREWIERPVGLLPSRQIVFYGIPMGLIVVLGSVQPFLERIITGAAISAEALGYYAVAAKGAMLLALPVGAFQTAFSPFLFSTYREADASETLNVILKIFVTVLSAAVLFIATFSTKIIEILAGEVFLAGASAVLPLTWAIYFQAVGLFLGTGTILTQKTQYRLFSYAVATIVGVVAMFYLGGSWGIVGIAGGVALGKLVMLTLETVLSNRLWPIAWDYRFAIFNLGVTVLLSHIIYSSQLTFVLEAVEFVLCLLVVVSVTWIFATAAERQLFAAVLNRARNRV